MQPHWTIETPFIIRDTFNTLTLSGEKGAVERAAACLDGCVGLRDPAKVRTMIDLLQILVGNRSSDDWRRSGNEDRAAVAEALAKVL